MASLDPTSREYKRARRHHYKTTKNRTEGFDTDWTPFRVAEKKYKARFPPPDLSDVLDLALLDKARSSEIERAGWKGRADAIQTKAIGLKDAQATPAGMRKAFTVNDIPGAQDLMTPYGLFPCPDICLVFHLKGLVVLPSFVSEGTQRDLIRWSLDEHARHPNETNLDAHYFLPPSGLWSTYLHSPETIIQPRTPGPSIITSPLPDASGPRRLISNTPASPATFSVLKSTPRPPPVPSTHSQPVSAAELIPRLRWANIGWSYHWGTKLYDFTREVQPVGEPFRKVCIEVVRSINWHDVFGDLDTESAGGWGDEGPDWQAWGETYGRCPEHIIRICGRHSNCALAEPDAGIVNFYQTKDTLMGHVDHSEICATSPLVSISWAFPFSITLPLLICCPFLASETPQSSSSVVSRAMLLQSR